MTPAPVLQMLFAKSTSVTFGMLLTEFKALLTSAPTCCRYYESADIWAFGMLLIELARGRAPYANFSLTNIIMMTLHSDPPELDSDCHCEVCQLCSAASCTITSRCLESDAHLHVQLLLAQVCTTDRRHRRANMQLQS